MGVAEKLVGHGVKAFTESRFALAADLGQSNDPTAVAVIEHCRTVTLHWKGNQQRATTDTFDVRYLRRLPLGVSYVEQVAEIARLLRCPPLDANSEFGIDETAIGRPVGDLFNAAGVHPTRITITSGEAVSRKGPKRYHVGKGFLVSLLDAKLHSGELRFARELAEAPAMRDELRQFRRRVSAAGRFSFEARAGAHDDLVLSCAIGLFLLASRPKIPTAVCTRATYFKENRA